MTPRAWYSHPMSWLRPIALFVWDVILWVLLVILGALTVAAVFYSIIYLAVALGAMKEATP